MNAAQPRGTPGADKLGGDAVRARCISDGTVGRYRSYINGIRKWVMTNKNIINPQRFFDASGDLDPRRLTPKDFESFFVDKRETLKASTLGGYRSAMKDLYRRRNLPLPPEYGEVMMTLFSGLKRLEAERDQSGDARESGKRLLTYSIYVMLCKLTLARDGGGFAHLFQATQWDLVCRSKSVEIIQMSHLVCADDSVGIVLHKTKTNQEGSGPKDPRTCTPTPDLQ
ncbi:hypothetical protein PI124_g13738 [Phytophthora idaei]|nr:hypothetical protein PI125_g14047 [Phytophthora idaei]KAG3144041.1 hypothetical protein PI126_g14330 [Phytophthora idaei]KAG3241401.1 hypothetical protein PI124_g13738 [Phytophthora idaei]